MVGLRWQGSAASGLDSTLIAVSPVTLSFPQLIQHIIYKLKVNVNAEKVKRITKEISQMR